MFWAMARPGSHPPATHPYLPALRQPPNPADAAFRATGLERAAALAEDLAWFQSTYGIAAPQLSESGPGACAEGAGGR